MFNLKVLGYGLCLRFFFVMVMQFMPQLNSSDLLRKAQYQPEKYLLYETLQDTGILSGVRVTADREDNRVLDEQVNTVQRYSVVHMYTTRRNTRH
jgi:hypothetical protein